MDLDQHLAQGLPPPSDLSATSVGPGFLKKHSEDQVQELPLWTNSKFMTLYFPMQNVANPDSEHSQEQGSRPGCAGESRYPHQLDKSGLWPRGSPVLLKQPFFHDRRPEFC